MVLGRLLLVVALGMPLLACGTGQELRPQPSAGAQRPGEPLVAGFAPWSDAVPGYRIGEGDKLKVLFPLTPAETQDVLVRPDGVVTLRATGEVQIAELTPAAASALLAEKAGAKLRKPEVLVEVTDPISAKIYVGGEVGMPGAYRVIGPMHAVAALQLAQGPKDTARLSEVILIRRSPDDRPMLKLIDVHSLIEGKPAEDPRILPGDILYVPMTRVAEVGLWVEQFINRIVPFQRSFSYTRGRTTGG